MKDLPCAGYAIAHMEMRIRDGLTLPGIILHHIDFRNREDFETIYRYLVSRKLSQQVQHVCMSCIDDPKFFREFDEHVRQTTGRRKLSGNAIDNNPGEEWVVKKAI